MSSKMIVSMAMATMSLFFAVGCSTDAKKKSESSQAETTQIKGQKGQEKYLALDYDKQATKLDETDKAKLKSFITRDEKYQKIEDIIVLSWADKPYSPGKNPSSDQVQLANQRAQNIEKYLKEELKVQKNVDLYNMTEKPGSLTKIPKKEDEKIESKQLNLPPRESTAIIMFKYQEGKNTIL